MIFYLTISKPNKTEVDHIINCLKIYTDHKKNEDEISQKASKNGWKRDIFGFCRPSFPIGGTDS